jgi:uncharacterized membrane protein
MERAIAMRPALAGGAVLAALAAAVYTPGLAGWAAQGPDWSLLANETVALKVHLGAAIGTLLVGVLLLTGVKGRTWHKRLGWSWVAMMAATAVSSFWLQRVQPGSFSWIHGLSGWTLGGPSRGRLCRAAQAHKAPPTHDDGAVPGGNTHRRRLRPVARTPVVEVRLRMNETGGPEAARPEAYC